MRVAQAEKTIQHYVEKYDMAAFLNDDMLRHLQLYRFEPYTHVYIEEDEQYNLYFLVEGQLQCNHYHMNGKLAVFALSTPFTAIGDLEILSDQPLNSNVIATEATVMLGIARDYVEAYGADDPRFLRFLLDELRTKIYHTTMLQTSHVLPVINRLAVYILTQTRDATESVTITLPAKEELASMLGTTTRHLNRVLKQLVEADIITSGYPRIHIHNREALRHLTE